MKSVAKIIDLKGKKKLKDDLARAEKVEALMALIRCHHCPKRCAKCAEHADTTVPVNHPGLDVSFRLCPLCFSEYQDFMAHMDAEKPLESPSWHNRSWIRLWLAWLDYRWALANYVSSPEVLAVLAEIKEK
ncbi:MAG: hypothetical protein HQK55_04040 [Deltaproteobacteria bacterium]|nr:hypothetical protein [Deltaproteobacteria bacterium]